MVINYLRSFVCGGTELAHWGDMNAGMLSRIRLLNYNLIYPYEWPLSGPYQASVEVDRSSVVKHPFPVMHVEQGRYLLLDGSPLFSRMADFGLPHVPVQICSQEDIRVVSEQLGLEGILATDLEEMADHCPEQLVVADPGEPAPSGYLTIDFTFEEGTSSRLFLRQTNYSGCPEALQRVFRTIEEKGRYLPLLRGVLREGSLFKTATLSGTMKLPQFKISDVAGAVTSGQLFPPNVLTVAANSRVFSIDFPLSVLRSSIPVEEKEAFLRDLIAYREQSHKTTFFEGQVYFLNR